MTASEPDWRVCFRMNDKTITVYNYCRNSDKAEYWQRTVIYGVEYSYHLEKTVSSNGALVLTELLSVIIPAEADASGKSYIDCVSYSGLLDGERGQYWTINPSCNKEIIVCGESDREITEEYKITDLKKDFQKAGTIAGFSDNTEGALLKHYKVVCK